MAPARALVLTAGLGLAAGLRLAENLLSEATEVEPTGMKAVEGGDGELDQSKCTAPLVRDAGRCGVETLIEQVKDAGKCGTKWCNNRMTFNVCAKTCGVTVSRAKVCEALDQMVCPVRITMTIKGSAPTTSIEGMQFKATLVDFNVEQNSQEITDTLNANKKRITPEMQKGMNLGVEVGNKMVVEQTTAFEDTITKTMEQEAITKYAWLARVLVGGKGFVEGVTSAMHQRFKKIGAQMVTRSEVDIEVDGSNKEKLCHRLLRITPSEGEPYYIKDWKNALIARKYDEKTDCNSAYVAHCGTGTMVKTKKCPLQEVEVTKSCMFSALCWKGSRSIQGGKTKVSTLYKGETEIKVKGDISITHVAADSQAAARSNTPFSQKVVEAADADKMAPEKLNTLVQIQDPELPRVLRDEVCKRVRANSWRIFGGLKETRCRLVLRGLLSLGSLGSPKVNLGKPTDVDMAVSDGVFRATFIPEWKGIAEVAEQALFDALKGEKFPFSAELKALNLKMDGDGEQFFFEASPVLYGKIDAKELQEFIKNVGDNQDDFLPPQR